MSKPQSHIVAGIALALLLLPVTFGAWFIAWMALGFSPQIDRTVIVAALAFVAMIALNVALPLGVAFRWPEIRRGLKAIPMPVLLLVLGLLVGSAVVVMANGGLGGYQISVPGGM